MCDCLYIYASLNDSSIKILSRLAKELGVRYDSREFHCTIIHSNRKIPKYVIENNLYKSYTFFATPTKIETWIRDCKYYTVLLLESVVLKNLHEKWKNLGVVHNYQNYIPHITLSVNRIKVALKSDNINDVEYVGFNGELFQDI